MEVEFHYPPFHNLPPFFTSQPVLDTKKKQLSLWCDLVLDYVRHFKLHELDLNEIGNTALFSNKQIKRRASQPFIVEIFEYIVNKGKAAWLPGKKRILVYWRSPEEWGSIIYNYIRENSMIGVVCTYYELRESEEVENQAFFQLEPSIFEQALKSLENTQKAKLLNVGGKSGIKFF